MAVPTTLLGKLKLVLGIASDNTDSDDLLTYYLTRAEQKILDRCYPFDTEQFEVPPRYLEKQVEIAEFLYDKRGATGQTAHSENGISRTYGGADVPEAMLRGITPFVGGFAYDEEDDEDDEDA